MRKDEQTRQSTLRDELNSAFTANGVKDDDDEPLETADDTGSATDEETDTNNQTPDSEEPEGTQSGEASDDARDDDAPALGASDSEESATPKSDEKPPQGWTTPAKAEWDKVPDTVRQEVRKRETEIARALNETAQVRNFASNFQRMLQPYQPLITAQGGDALGTINTFMQAAASLHGGNQARKAQVVADIIRDFGVDLATLDNTLAGKAPAQQPSRAEPDTNNPLYAKVQQLEQYINNEQQTKRQTVAQETQAFLDANPHANDVRNEMADFLDVAQQQGRSMTLKEAYDRALALRPDLQAKANPPTPAPRKSATLEQARQARSSMSQRSPVASGGQQKPESLRGLIGDAWDQHAGA